MMNPFLKPSFPFRFCSSFLSDMQTQPPCFPYNLIQSNVCYIHTESCERSIRSHTITPQNAFNELPQSSLRAHRTSLRCTWGSSPTRAVQNVDGTCSPWREGGCWNAHEEDWPQCRSQPARYWRQRWTQALPQSSRSLRRKELAVIYLLRPRRPARPPPSWYLTTSSPTPYWAGLLWILPRYKMVDGS